MNDGYIPNDYPSWEYLLWGYGVTHVMELSRRMMTNPTPDPYGHRYTVHLEFEAVRWGLYLEDAGL